MVDGYNVREQINALKQLRALGSYGNKSKIAVLDGAIDTQHPMFHHTHINILSKKEEESTYHGTAVAGLIAGKAIGISPLSNIVSIPVFNEDKHGHLYGCSELKLANAINRARAEGCQLINISGSALSQTGNGTDQLRNAIEACLNSNIPIIAAVGNNGLCSESIPASMEHVIAIGAHDINGKSAQFNNFGTKLHSKMILAPGVDIPIELQQGKFAHISGTSFASPIVSAIVSLLIQAIRSVNSTYTATEIHNLLQNASAATSRKNKHDQRKRFKHLNLVVLLQQLQACYPSLKKQSSDSTSRRVSMKPTEADSNTEAEPMMNSSNIQPAEHSTIETENTGQAEISPANHKVESSTASTHSMPMQKIDDPAANNFVHSTTGTDRNIIQPQASAAYESNIDADEKVFALGEVGYDFLTETNLDYFQQAMQSAPEDARGTGIPSHEVSMAKFLNYEVGGVKPYMENCTALMWTLKVDGIPVYAIRPQNQFAIVEFDKLIGFLIGKYGLNSEQVNNASPEQVLQLKNNRTESEDKVSSNKIDVISIAGSIVDEVRLYNGHVVPVISPILRGMFAWTPALIANALYHDINDHKNAGKREMLMNFLHRVYYELRNRGASPIERAMNYAATNAYQAGEVFEDVLDENSDYVLNKIYADKSPVCRPGADCWDVMFEFFNPQQRTEQARKIYRYTIDVSGLMPVTFGKLRSWYAY